MAAISPELVTPDFSDDFGKLGQTGRSLRRGNLSSVFHGVREEHDVALGRRDLTVVGMPAELRWRAMCRLVIRTSAQGREFNAQRLTRFSRARFFWQQSDPHTGITRQCARTFAGHEEHGPERRDIGSTGATGFSITALCIGAERGWVTREPARERVRATLRCYAEGPVRNEHGWFYHWLNVKSGERTGAAFDVAALGHASADAKRPFSEVSVSDSTWLVAGALTAKQYFHDDAQIARWADTIYGRIDYRPGFTRPRWPRASGER